MSDSWPDGADETARLVNLWEQHMSRRFTPRHGLLPSNAVQIWTFAHHAARLSRAVITLHEAGHDLEAMPLIRQTLECAMNAAWLLVTETGGPALSAVDTKNRRVMYREVTELGMADLSEVLKRVEREEVRDAETVTHTRSFEERCRAVSGGRHIYAMWRTLSLYSHATSSIADVYLESVPVTLEAPLGVAMLLEADWDQADTWMRVQALMLLLAQIAADDAQAKPVHRTQLARARKRLGVTWQIRPADAD
ncbi:DUF5677 domain-containing protein [Microbacterium proteolyticum]|uniref:DUF5677 domain-containing protein n=1 Tax=Microbacterium proteolyticum TaxID=1572644 RepID=UPI001FABCE5B|nr:DUF5677 domain-containing protein [Microbacterium proteolyticum]MCI9856780.1 hypothetical protein [Microbacterium proteolyticum]